MKTQHEYKGCTIKKKKESLMKLILYFSSPVEAPHNSKCNLYGEICLQQIGAFLSLHPV